MILPSFENLALYDDSMVLLQPDLVPEGIEQSRQVELLRIFLLKHNHTTCLVYIYAEILPSDERLIHCFMKPTHQNFPELGNLLVVEAVLLLPY